SVRLTPFGAWILGLGRPVLLPEEGGRYVLVSARPTVWAGPIEARYRDRPPAGFVLGPTWSGWRWYRRAAPDEGFRVPNPLYPTATGMIQLSQMSSQNLPTWSIGEGRKGKCLCGGSGAIGTIGATSGDAGDPHARLLHASGHAGEDELAAFVRAVRPRMLVPVHAERPERWREILRGTNIQVGIPEPGQPIPIG
ncbi:MAG: hypothetical protein NZ572_08125, partial [Thermoflexus sp.]|nr:hypothetical protein [Thermoflexus sp.]